MFVCRKYLQYAQKLKKRYYDKLAKPKSYASGDTVLFNSQYIKTKQNHKLQFKFFRLFRVLQWVGKQAYKFKLPKR